MMIDLRLQQVFLCLLLSPLCLGSSGFCAYGQTGGEAGEGTASVPPVSGPREPRSLTVERSDKDASQRWILYEIGAAQALTGDGSGPAFVPLLEIVCFERGGTHIEFRTGELRAGSEVAITIENLPSVNLVYGSLPSPYTDTILVADLKHGGQMANIDSKHLSALFAARSPVRLEFRPLNQKKKVTVEFDTTKLFAEFKKNPECVQ